MYNDVKSVLKKGDASQYFDPNDLAKQTVKQTTLHNDVKSVLKKGEGGHYFDPNDQSKQTIKQTTLHNKLSGSIKVNDKTYANQQDDVKRTIKETTMHNKITTGPNNNNKGNYSTLQDEAKTTIKETTIKQNYKGVVNTTTKQQIYDDYLNAEIDDRREILTYNRKPTDKKQSIGPNASNINATFKDDDNSMRPNHISRPLAYKTPNDLKITNTYNCDVNRLLPRDRISFTDNVNLQSLKNNPYSLPSYSKS